MIGLWFAAFLYVAPPDPASIPPETWLLHERGPDVFRINDSGKIEVEATGTLHLSGLLRDDSDTGFAWRLLRDLPEPNLDWGLRWGTWRVNGPSMHYRVVYTEK